MVYQIVVPKYYIFMLIYMKSIKWDGTLCILKYYLKKMLSTAYGQNRYMRQTVFGGKCKNNNCVQQFWTRILSLFSFFAKKSCIGVCLAMVHISIVKHLAACFVPMKENTWGKCVTYGTISSLQWIGVCYCLFFYAHQKLFKQ